MYQETDLNLVWLGECKHLHFDFLTEADQRLWHDEFGPPATAATSRIMFADLLQLARYIALPGLSVQAMSGHHF